MISLATWSLLLQTCGRGGREGGVIILGNKSIVSAVQVGSNVESIFFMYLSIVILKKEIICI